MVSSKSRFKKTVTPGDQINFEVSLEKFRLGTCKIVGIAKVDDKIVAEANIKLKEIKINFLNLLKDWPKKIIIIARK